MSFISLFSLPDVDLNPCPLFVYLFTSCGFGVHVSEPVSVVSFVFTWYGFGVDGSEPMFLLVSLTYLT